MERTVAAGLIEENLHTIFAWAMSKLYDKSEAEDLAQDIIYAVLKSVHRLENDEAFWGFLWKVAQNTLMSRLRKKRFDEVELEEHFCGTYWITPEDEFIKSEEIQLLRRELALLSNQYREVTVRYYIYGKSCSEISAELDISAEMVKYYLFKTRKILKEGIGMNREYGEKSYNPSTFRVDFWGGNSNPYFDLFERRLPGNIVLSAYDKPVTITELSVELGVAAVYLEDEIEVLERYEILKKTGDKYQTNIVIFTDAYEKRVLERFRPVFEAVAEKVNGQLEELLPKLKELDFYGKEKDENYLKWLFVNLAVYQGLSESDCRHREKFGDYPALANGSCGFVFGYDNDYENHHFHGIYGDGENEDRTASVSVVNYRVLEKCQRVQYGGNWKNSIRALTGAVLFAQADESNDEVVRFINEGVIRANNGKLSPNFPVFSENVLEEVKGILAPVSHDVCECMTQICGIATETLKDYVPKALKDKCGQLAWINHQMDVMAFIVETMVAREQLMIPTEKVNPCMFGVDRRK